MPSLCRTPVLIVSAPKPKQALGVCCLLTGWLSLVVAGCGAVAEQETAAFDEAESLESIVDAQVLENIKKLESGIVGPAMQHEGRIWYGPDLVTTFLTTHDGSGMAFTLGDARTYATLDPPPPIGVAAPLSDVLARQEVEPAHVFSSESGLDVILFEAPPRTGAGIGQTSEALAGPQACPSTVFSQTCNPDNHLQYADSVNRSLSESDRTTNLGLSESNIVSSTVAVCSENGGLQLVVTTSNPAWGTVPGGTGTGGLSIPHGHIGSWSNYGTWRERRFCANSVLGVCLDHDYRIQFQNFDVALSVTKLNFASEYSYCANFYAKSDEVKEHACNNIFCPVIRPGG